MITETHGDAGAVALDDATARIAYEAAGYVNWDRQPESVKYIHRWAAAAVLAHGRDEAAARIEALEAALQSSVDALHLFLLATGGPNDMQTCNAILNGKLAHDAARAALENRHG